MAPASKGSWGGQRCGEQGQQRAGGASIPSRLKLLTSRVCGPLRLPSRELP